MEHHESSASGELALIYRAARGDHEAFRALVIAYEQRILAYLLQMLGDQDSARDVAQETFIAVFHNLPRWRPATAQEAKALNIDVESAPLAPWLYRIATNRALSLLRKQQVRQRVHTSDEHSVEYQHARRREIYTQHTSFEEGYAARELLREALQQLSEEDAACLVLRFVGGERYADIAAKLGLSSEAVRKRVNRALPALRKAYLALDTEVYS